MEEQERQYIEALMRVLEINQMIAKQNALIVQALTLPQLMIKPEERDD